MSRGFGYPKRNSRKKVMHTSAKYLILKEMALFNTLSENELNMIAHAALYEKVAKNKTIYQAGSKADYVYVIEKGSVKSGNYASDGRLMIKEIYYDGELFGENIFSPHRVRNEFAESMTECRFFKIDAYTFRKILEKNPLFASQIIELVIKRMQYIEERLQSFVFKNAKTRIAEFIHKTGLKKGLKIGIDECLINQGMSHREIAYLTDTSRQTVARVLNELKKANIIHYGSTKACKILIRNMDSLLKYQAHIA